MNILLVDDDAAQAAAAESVLQLSGHNISTVNCGENAVRFLKTNTVDLMILDWQLPGRAGLEILHWTRRNLGDEPAVLLITNEALEVELDRVLEEGADDYVIKPFRTAELVARISALVRRTKRNGKIVPRISIGPYVLDGACRGISLHGQTIELTTKEFDLVTYFFNHIGQVVSRDVLAKLAWGRELDSASRTIDTHIYRLRRKLCLLPQNGVCLNTVHMRGYKLDEVGPVTDEA